MRRRKAEIGARVNGELELEFTASGLTSYAGLELLVRYFRTIDLNRMIRRHIDGLSLGGDFGASAMIRVLLVLLIAGGQRLRHVQYLANDVLVRRFCGLRVLPGERTLSRWLKRFTMPSVDALANLNADVVARTIQQSGCRTLTLDVDGTVVSTGMTVERAFRGFNPHHRKVPSYYPITAYCAETHQMFRVRNRSGNVHDGKASPTFLRQVIAQVNQRVGEGYGLNFRFDGAFFRQDVINLLDANGAGYAIKVPFWRWIDLQTLIRRGPRWVRVANGVDGFEADVELRPWRMTLRVAIYRKRVAHQTAKNFQLDLFDPDDGTYEYHAVATNLSLTIKNLWRFMCGRGAHEKAIGELRSGLAFDTVPTDRYAANAAWQQLSAIAHNLLVAFQCDTTALKRPRTRKTTAIYCLKSVRSLRFEIFNRAGELIRPQGTAILRLAENTPTKLHFCRIVEALRAA